MKKLLFILILFSTILILFFIFGCNKEEEKEVVEEQIIIKAEDSLFVSWLAYPNSILIDNFIDDYNPELKVEVWRIKTQPDELYEDIYKYYSFLKEEDFEINDVLIYEYENQEGSIYIDPNPTEKLEYEILIKLNEKAVE